MRLSSIKTKPLTGLGMTDQVYETPVPMIMEAVVPSDPSAASSVYLKVPTPALVTIDWGDGIVEDFTYGGFGYIVSHDYTTGNAALGSTVTITITGYLPTYGGWDIGMSPGQGQNFITKVIQFNNTTKNFSWAFEGELLLTEVPSSLPRNVTNTTGMFWGCISLGINDTSYVTGVTDTDFGAFQTFSSAGYLQISGLMSTFQSYFDAELFGAGDLVLVESISGLRQIRTISSINHTYGDNIVIFNFVEQAPGSGLSVERLTVIKGNSINNWDVSKVTKMNYMFTSCNAFDGYLGSWDVTSVTDMSYMFDMVTGFIPLPDAAFTGAGLRLWDVSGVTNMTAMFINCKSFNEPIGVWDVGNVEDMSYMFAHCVIFNQPIGGWDTSGVRFGETANYSNTWGFDYMFNDTPAFNQNLMGWDTSGMAGLTYGQYYVGFDISGQGGENPAWGMAQTPLLVRFEGAFADLYFFTGNGLVGNILIDWGDGTRQASLTTTGNNGPYSNGQYVHGYSTEGTHYVTVSGYLPNMQGGTIGYGNPIVPQTSGLTAVGQWNSTMVHLSGAFEHRGALVSVPNYLPPSVTDISYMFLETAQFNDPNVRQWDVSNVTNMYGFLHNAQAFSQDLSSWNVGNFATDPWIYDTIPALDPVFYPAWNTHGNQFTHLQYITGYTIDQAYQTATIIFTNYPDAQTFLDYINDGLYATKDVYIIDRGDVQLQEITLTYDYLPALSYNITPYGSIGEYAVTIQSTAMYVANRGNYYKDQSGGNSLVIGAIRW